MPTFREEGAHLQTATPRESKVAEGSLALLAAGAVLAFLWLARDLVLPTVLALFLAFTVHPVVLWLERRKLPRSVAAVAGTLLTVLVLAAVVAVLYNRIAAFWDELPNLGKQLRLSSMVVFLGSLFWFWIWGPVGLFLAVPLLSTIRIACMHVPRLRWISELLGE